MNLRFHSINGYSLEIIRLWAFIFNKDIGDGLFMFIFIFNKDIGDGLFMFTYNCMYI